MSAVQWRGLGPFWEESDREEQLPVDTRSDVWFYNWAISNGNGMPEQHDLFSDRDSSDHWFVVSFSLRQSASLLNTAPVDGFIDNNSKSGNHYLDLVLD